LHSLISQETKANFIPWSQAVMGEAGGWAIVDMGRNWEAAGEALDTAVDVDVRRPPAAPASTGVAPTPDEGSGTSPDTEAGPSLDIGGGSIQQS